MTAALLQPLCPLIILCLGAVVLLLLAAFFRKPPLLAIITAAVLLGASLRVYLLFGQPPVHVGNLFLIDSYALFYLALILLCSLVVALLGISYPVPVPAKLAELYPLLLLSTAGAGTIVCSSHFVSFFLGLEILSVSGYVLIAYMRSAPGYEAGLKYLILSSVSSAFLLLGIALLYFQYGTMAFGELFSQAAADPYLYAGLALVIVGSGFKIAVVPFHMWAPDIYQGASAPVAAFIATVSKAGIFAFLLRYLAAAGDHGYGRLGLVITVIAIASMFAGNLLALFQDNVKRILAYSSIAQAGYVLVAFEASGALALQAVAYYLVVYFLSILGAFGVISVLAYQGNERETIAEYHGLAWRNPLLAAVFAVMLFSLAGIPLTAGFIGKFYLLSAGIRSQLWLLIGALMISSVIGLFYYLRLIVALYRPESEVAAEPSRAVSPLGSFVLSVLGLLVLALGVYPGLFIQLLTNMF